MTTYVAYYRVSTKRQGESGLSLEAQKSDVLRYITEQKGVILNEYTEVESGGKNDRPQVLKAIDDCLRTGATLVIAKLDRLSRNVIFVETLKEKGVKFVCCDMPTVNELVISIYAVIAQDERKRIRERIMKGFEAKRAKGEKWGGISPNHPANHMENMRKARKPAVIDEKLKYVIMEELNKNTTLGGIAAVLNGQGYKTYEGKEFTAVQVMRLRNRIEATI